MIPTINLDHLETGIRDALLNGQDAALAHLIVGEYERAKASHWLNDALMFIGRLSDSDEASLTEHDCASDCPAQEFCHAG